MAALELTIPRSTAHVCQLLNSMSSHGTRQGTKQIHRPPVGRLSFMPSPRSHRQPRDLPEWDSSHSEPPFSPAAAHHDRRGFTSPAHHYASPRLTPWDPCQRRPASSRVARLPLLACHLFRPSLAPSFTPSIMSGPPHRPHCGRWIPYPSKSCYLGPCCFVLSP